MKWISGFIVLSSVVLMLTGCEQAEQPVADEPAMPEVVAAPGETESTVVTVAPMDQTVAESAMNGDIVAVKQALAKGLDINAVDEGKRTLLMFACFNGHTELAKFLIGAGAAVDQREKTNRTALMFAATGPNVDTVKMLIEMGAEVNAIDSHEDWTALMIASAEGQTEVVNLLLANGADATMKDTDGEDSAYFARQRKFEALAQVLDKAAASK
ncbi:MAG: ankyrin repeat domain-containing protein [Verrucomicrobiales bacterium]